MMSENYSKSNNGLSRLERAFWKTVDELRQYLPVEDYYLALYLLVVHRSKFEFEISDYSGKLKKVKVDLISNDEKNVDVELLNIHQALRSKLETLPKHVFEDISNLLKETEWELSDLEFALLFEQVLYKLAKLSGKGSQGYIMPVELSRFMLAMAEPQPESKIYNPFAGVASFGVLNGSDCYYFGEELNSTIWAIGELRLLVHGKDVNSSYHVGDSIKNWSPSAQNKMDLIISQPPFGYRLQEPVTGKHGPIRTAEQFLIDRGLESLNEEGKLVVCLSNGFLFREGPEKSLRKYLVEADLLETVISFPQGLLMNTGIPVSVIVINLAKCHKGLVQFVDASSHVIRLNSREHILNYQSLVAEIRNDTSAEFVRYVKNDSIVENDYNFVVSRYFQTEIEGSQKIGNLGIIINGRKATEGEFGPFVSISNLKSDRFDFLIDENCIESVTVPRNATLIEESCLLISLRGNALKPTYFSYQSIPIYISLDLLAFKLNLDKIDKSYFIGELHSDYVLSQVNSLKIGDAIPRIRKEDFLSLKIQVVSTEAQKAKVNGVAMAFAAQKKRELLSFNKIHGLEKEIYEQNTYLRHTLAGPISNLRNSFAKILQIVNEQIIPIVPEALSLKVKGNQSSDLAKYFEIAERDLAKLYNAVKQQTSDGTNFNSKPLVQFDILDFLRKYSSELSESEEMNFEIEFTYDDTSFLEQDSGVEIKPLIYGNPDLLTDMLNNLVDNAVNHAFSEGNKRRIEIFLMKSDTIIFSNSEELVPVVTILISNTGTPFPKDYSLSDFIRKGSSAGITGGDGFGGWYINEIIKFHRGSLDMIDETGPEGLPDSDLATSFEIDIPLIDSNEAI